MFVNSVRLEKRLASALVCATLWGGVIALPAWAEEAPSATAVSAAAVAERGIQRAALLRSLFNGQTIVTLELTGQQPDMVEPLRLDEAVALALKNNFEVQASGAKTDSADWDVVGAYGAYLPTVTYSYATGKERSSPAAFKNANDETVADNTHHRRDKDLSIRQPIVDPALIAEILARHKSQTAAGIEETGTRERIAVQTINAYYQIVGACLLIRFAEDYKAQLDKLNELMKSRVEGGGAAQADLDRIKARSVSAQSAIIETKSTFDAAVDEFRRLTGVTPLRFQLPGSLLPTPPATIEEALTRAIRQNPDYLLSEKQMEVQLAQRDKALSRLLPKVSFELTKSRSWNAGGVALGANASGTDQIFPYENEKKAMVVTSWTLAGGSDIAESLSSGAKAREANFKSLDTRARIEQLVRTSYNALTAAQSRVPVLQQAVDSNAKVVSAFEEQYMNANRPLFDLLDAYERAYSAHADLTRVMMAEAYAGHQLRQQMGELVMALRESEQRLRQAPPEPVEEPQPEAKNEPAPKNEEPPPVEAAPREKVQPEPKR